MGKAKKKIKVIKPKVIDEPPAATENGKKVQVQQLLDGKLTEEAFETKHYFIMEAKGTGLRIRYTEASEETAQERHSKLTNQGKAKAADGYRYEWIINRLRAKDLQVNDKKIMEAIHAFHRVFWAIPPIRPEPLIEEREEDVEYIEIRSYKFCIRARAESWEKKLDKWAAGLFPLKPKDAKKRAEKAREAKGKVLAWIDDHAKLRRGEKATDAEREAYVKVLQDHIMERLDQKVRARTGNQATLEV